jgi:hypothetical protein
VPAYNAGHTILTALRSLADQTWSNIEVLVVDDASTDGTREIVEAFCVEDRRFRLIAQETNVGTYLCRNRALKNLTAEFITVHDADDWAHPQKIERQVRDLVNHVIPFNISDSARATDQLVFTGFAQFPAIVIQKNRSSAMFHGWVFDRCARWEPVRASGDTEFINRVCRIFEIPEPNAIMEGCPLTLCRATSTSLTKSHATSVLTVRYGARRVYREAAASWHASLNPAEIRAQGLPGPPPFVPSPPALDSQRERLALDLVIVTNWNAAEDSTRLAWDLHTVSRESGLRVGTFHYPSYVRGDVLEPIHDTLFRLARQEVSYVVSPGERVEARGVVFFDPSLLAHSLDMFPQVSHRRVFIVVNSALSPRSYHGDFEYEPERVRRHLSEWFGHEGEWLATSDLVRRQLADDSRYPDPRADLLYSPPTLLEAIA